MSQAQTPEAGQQAPNKCVALITGRIQSFRAASGQRGGFLTVLKLPAPDTFTSPATIEVHSAQKLGDVETIVHGKVRIGGYSRSYKANREDAHGRPFTETVYTADNTLDWLA